MSSKELQDMMADSDKKLSETTNALARLYRIILKDHNVGYSQLSTSINNYIERQQRLNPRSKKELSREKSNLIKELKQNSFTFKKFVKGLRVLNPISVKITADITWSRKRISTHSVEMLIRDNRELDNDSDDDE